MPFDLAAHLGAMTRIVETVERDGKPAKAIIAARVFDTEATDLWDALTNRERLPRWFAPVSGDLRLGGRYQIKGNAEGTISECDPPKHFSLTWEFGGTVSWVKVTLTSEQRGTRLTLEHVAHVPEEMWTQFGPGAVGVGWDLGFMGLARYLASPDHEPAPEAIKAWETSPEAMNMYRITSDAWARAAVADGTPEADASGAAERTRAFYSGEAPATE